MVVSGVDPSKDEVHPAVVAWFLRPLRDAAPAPVDKPQTTFVVVHGSAPYFPGHVLGQLGLHVDLVQVVTTD